MLGRTQEQLKEGDCLLTCLVQELWDNGYLMSRVWECRVSRRNLIESQQVAEGDSFRGHAQAVGNVSNFTLNTNVNVTKRINDIF